MLTNLQNVMLDTLSPCTHFDAVMMNGGASERVQLNEWTKGRMRRRTTCIHQLGLNLTLKHIRARESFYAEELALRDAQQ